MKEKTLNIRNYIAKIPLIQGGMGVGVSLGGLAGAVAECGAVGIISTAQIGFREKTFRSNPLKANLLAMQKEFEKARSLAREGIIGFNIMVATRNYKEYIKKAVELKAPLIISGAGLPMDLPEYTKGTDTCIAPIVSSAKAAKLILKYWDRKFGETADLVVIEGPMAGGHLGFKYEQLEQLDAITYEQEILKIAEVVREYEKQYERKIPIVFAGGIHDKKQVRHVFSLGLDGVQVASRFVTTKECDASDAYKDAYLHARKEDITIIKSPVGMPGRAVRNEFVKRLEKGETKAVTQCYQCLSHCNPKEIPYCITEALIRAVSGDIKEGLIFCGGYSYMSKKIESVKEVIDSLMNLDV